MSIKNKLICSFLIIALIGVAGGITEFISINKVTSPFYDIVEETIPELLIMDKLEYNIINYGELVETIALSDAKLSPREKEKHIHYIHDIEANADKLLRIEEVNENIEREVLEQKLKNEFFDLIKTYIAHNNNLIDIKENTENDIDDQLIAQSKSMKFAALDVLNKEKNNEKEELGIKEKLAVKTVKNTKITLFSTSLLSIFLSVLLGYHLSRSISNPIDKILKSLSAFVKGDRHQKIEINKNDELGELSLFINGAFDEINHHKDELETKVQQRTEELTKSQAELKEALSKEKKLGILKSSFVSTASHQFRTPLAIIQSNSELLVMLFKTGDKNILPKLERATSRIQKEIKNMTTLMNDVLLLDKINSENGMPITKTATNMVELCTEITEQFNNIHETGRSISLNVSGTPIPVNTDNNLIRQVLNNLISNAFKYSVNNPKLGLFYETDHLRMVISDDGIGIPENELQDLFQPFYRASNVNDLPGTGLGLSIVKEYLERIQASIQVESTLHEGTEFIIYINYE